MGPPARTLLVSVLLVCAAGPARSAEDWGAPSASEFKGLLQGMRDAQAASLPGKALASAKAAAARRYSFPYQDVDVFSSAAEPFKPPYCVRYVDGDKRLVFLAARHKDKAETIPLTDKLFAAQPGPQVVIVERNDEQVKDAGMIAQYADEGEAEHAMLLAGKTGAAAWGGDPKPYEQLSAFLGLKTFGVRDFEGFYVLRTIAAERDGRLKSYFSTNDFTALVDKVAKEFQGEFKKAPGSSDADLFKESDLFTIDTFTAWYQDKNKKKLDFAALTPEEVWPAEKPALFSQQVAAGVSRVRDYFLGDRIAAGLNSHDLVLVVYGSGHYVEIARALKTMLGTEPLLSQRCR